MNSGPSGQVTEGPQRDPERAFKSLRGRVRSGDPSYVPPDSRLMVRPLPIAPQPRRRDAAFKDDARGSPCPSYRTASTTRLVAATTCCASSRIGGGSSVRAASHQRAAAWPSNPRKVPISGWPRRHPHEGGRKTASLEHPAGTFNPCDHPSSQVGAP